MTDMFSEEPWLWLRLPLVRHLQAAIRAWCADNDVFVKYPEHALPCLERLLRDVAALRDCEWDDNCGAPPRISLDETILQALKDENDGND